MATELDYRVQMDKLLFIGQAFAEITASMPLAEMAETVAKADAVGGVLDPTKYRDALWDGRLRKQRAAIEAARAFERAWREAGLPAGSDAARAAKTEG